MRRRLFFLLILIFMSQCHFLWAYHGDVHMKIDEYAVMPGISQLDSALKDQLGIANGIDTILEGKDTNGNRVKKMIKKWIAFGGEAEDYGWFGKRDYQSTRGFNHFHDPLIAMMTTHVEYSERFRHPVPIHSATPFRSISPPPVGVI